jgi:alkanesulfonate monooxygenase SsuD/methylene tetrahydromethanopterin reductase-like flavin-dependent oxidoreductase (luciferase family)
VGGWFAEEHAAYGIPFPAKRFGILTEQLEIVTGLWGTPVGETFDHAGKHYALTDSPALPKPVQRSPLDPSRAGVPIIVGGNGPRRTPALAARFAAEYNAAFPPKDQIADRFAGVRRACEDAVRDPGDLTYSVALVLCVGADEAEVARRAKTIGREPAELRENGIAGTVAEAVDTLGAIGAAGATRVYLQVHDVHDLEHLELVAAEIMPQLD